MERKDPVAPISWKRSLSEGADNPSFLNDFNQNDRAIDVEEGHLELDAKGLAKQLSVASEHRDDNEPIDPWALPEFKHTSTPWSELTSSGKVKRVLVDWIGKTIALLMLLYLFVCSLDFMSSAFRLLGGKTAGQAFRNSEVLTNPVGGVMAGILITVLVQSSSTSTSIVVTVVASGLLDVQPAIYLIMGANIGTSVTNTIVAMAQAGNRNEFRRAFGGATVHDMFNWLTVIVLLPIEALSHYLYRVTSLIVTEMTARNTTREDFDKELLKTITKPFTSLVVKIDKSIMYSIAKGQDLPDSASLNKRWCKFANKEITREIQNETHLYNVTEIEKVGVEKCHTLFALVSWSDSLVGAILLVVSLVSLCICLIFIVKLLNSIFRGQVAGMLRKFINADFPGCMSYFTGYIAMLVGAGFTVLVQSSSVFTSALTPLVGIGVLTIERMYALTLGANIGTTTTALLASLTASSDKLADTIQVALAHLFFNISGILIFYPIPFMRQIPIAMAKCLGNYTAKHRWVAVVYTFLTFLILPGTIFALSLAGWKVLVGVGCPILALILFVIIVNILQSKKPSWLPLVLRDWQFLPWWLRSLDAPAKLFANCKCANH
ncbi:PREDICTED: sodium-dependent phosphate transport protein 2B-like isoform X1 [Priapulus caudatus]|uniref:Sodium-dependent phosphate transport protein 2B-like isoform X1 n=1 Tax=Priapulus caudatus TaxID=37621 RepID=A0ABM1DRX5_PRICU|nr:PREDICTED: sodium-dependent phosphate transport protein 2B-like isoform X1 [Priapulus caudatus]XP_014662696.1 PREDICTED: sodium-dependent phosphate transport protein 2B-like isoform X1 [Priapulus caudatus]